MLLRGVMAFFIQNIKINLMGKIQTSSVSKPMVHRVNGAF
jgi:hypothetical protein